MTERISGLLLFTFWLDFKLSWSLYLKNWNV